MTKNYKPFSNPKWNQDPGANVIKENEKITREEKEWIKEQDKKWKETLKQLKERRNTQK